MTKRDSLSNLSPFFKRILPEYLDFVDSLFKEREYLTLLYGSSKTNKITSDLDIVTIASSFTESELNKLSMFTINFHRRNKLKLDFDVPYEKKCLYSFSEIERSLSGWSFPWQKGRFVVPPIKKDPVLLSSNEIKDRLILNVLTSKPLVVLNNSKKLRNWQRDAWNVIFRVLHSYLGNKPMNAKEFVYNLCINPYDGTGYKFYLGYSFDNSQIVEHLIEQYKNCVRIGVREGQIIKDGNKYYCDDAWINNLRFPINKEKFMKKIYIETNGCAVQRHETQRYAKFFRENGWKEISSPTNANVILMTTCGVVSSTEEEAIKAIKRLVKSAKKDTKILVGGCLPKINPQRIQKISKNLFMFGPKEARVLNDSFGNKRPIEDVFYNDGSFRDHSFGDPTIKYSREELDQEKICRSLNKQYKTNQFIDIYDYTTRGRHFWKERNLFEVKVSSGCVKNCNYCATKFAIGEFQSEKPEDILSQIKEGVRKGYKKIVLIGDEIGYYGIDINSTLFGLLKKIDSIKGNFSLALRYVHPDILIKEKSKLKEFFTSGKVYYFCAAFQSGSNHILKRMNRTPNIEKFVSTIKEIDKNYPNVFKHTQVIIGYPGETESDFLKTLAVLYECNFDYVTVTVYKDRPGTKSSKLDGHVSKNIASERYDRTIKVVSELREKQLWHRLQRELLSHI